MKIKYVLLVLVVMVAAVVISLKVAMAILFIGGLVTLIGLGAVTSAVLSLKPTSSHCTDENSPLINAVFGEESERS
jgi:hypothetical protein